MQAAGDHFAPFVLQVADIMRRSDDATAMGILITNLIRLLVIFCAVGMAYFVGYLIQTVVGTEYVVEEEVVIIEDVEEKDENKYRRPSKKSSRGKKKKQ